MTKSTTTDPIYGFAQAAKYLGITIHGLKSAVYRDEILTPDGSLDGFQNYFHQSTLDAYRRDHQTPPGYLTVSELAHVLCLSPQAVYNRIKAGTLTPDIQRGNRKFFKKSRFIFEPTQPETFFEDEEARSSNRPHINDRRTGISNG